MISRELIDIEEEGEKEAGEMERKESDYISLVCNYDREGLRHLGKHLLSLLDWRSLVRLKRASRQVESRRFAHDSMTSLEGVVFPPASAIFGKASSCIQACPRLGIRLP